MTNEIGENFILGVVIEKDDDMVQIKFLRQELRNVFVFPQVDDLSWEPKVNISILNPQPLLDNRGRFVFSSN